MARVTGRWKHWRGICIERHIVGAINVLERGHRLLACGEKVHLGRSMKQEPTEVNQLVFN